MLYTRHDEIGLSSTGLPPSLETEDERLKKENSNLRASGGGKEESDPLGRPWNRTARDLEDGCWRLNWFRGPATARR